MYRLWFEPPKILGHGPPINWVKFMYEILSDVPPNQNPGDAPGYNPNYFKIRLKAN